MTDAVCLNLSRQTMVPSANEVVWNAEETRARLGGARLLRQLFAYKASRLRVDDIEASLSPRPIMAARLLSRGAAVVEDWAGRSRTVSWWDLVQAAASIGADALAAPVLRARVQRDLLRLAGPAPVVPGGHGLVVVRTDLWYGLEAGGAAAHTAGILNALAQREAPIALLTGHDVPTLAPGVERIVVRPRRRWARAEWTLLDYNNALARAGAAQTRPRYVYQRHSLYGYAGACLARHFGAPLVLEYNGSEIWIGDHWGRRVAARDMALAVERTMLSAASLVTCVSRPLVEQAQAAGVAANRILLCPNAVDVTQYHPDIDGGPVRQRYGLGKAVVIGFIGTFGPWHGTRALAEAFVLMKRQLPDVDARLLMIGDGPGRSDAEAVIAAADLSASVAFTGLVAQETGAAHLAAADVLVSPTLENPDGTPFFGSPTKLFEYMAMGRAIVASGLDQVNELLAHEQTALLTPPGDVQALAQALARLCRDAALRKRLATAARTEAVRAHTWDHRADAILAALERISESGRTPAPAPGS